MKKVILMAALAAGVFSSCNNNELEGVQSNEAGKASINAVIEGSESRAGFESKTQWQDNDKLGLFMYKATGWGDAYPKFSSQNNEATKNAGGWSLAADMYLTADKAHVYAYYPYSATATDGTKVAVQAATTDYMWGKSNEISVANPVANIVMKHALSQFVLRLKVSPDYKNEGVLSAASLKAGQNKFATEGTMNLNDNGKITFTPAKTELSWQPNTTIPTVGSTPVDFAAAVFPISYQKDEATINVTIDNVKYEYKIPAIEWVAGKRYIYSVSLSSNGAQIGGEDGTSVTIEPWTDSVTENYEEILKRKNVVSKYFDLESFKLNCGEFLPGQRYENVCKDTQMDFASKKFIVFELTQIKQDRFLSNLVMSMIFSIIQKKLLSDRRKRGILIFDEYAETAQMTDTATGTGIHSSVAFCYQKIRKENGAVYTIVQTPEQLPDDENTKNIISNTDMLFVLPTKEVIYQSIIDKFKITRDYQIALMKSMRNNFSGPRPYSECFMRMGENYATVTRLEFSKEKFLAFQTEGEIWSDLEEKTKRMSMQDAITEYINEHKK